MDEKRLIDANDALINTYNEIYWTESEAAAVRDFLVHQKTVDAVEVVRCRDCRHMHCCSAIDRMFYCRHPKGLKGTLNIVGENPFCPYGERRTDG